MGDGSRLVWPRSVTDGGAGLTSRAGLWWLALIGILNSAFSMAYYLRVMKNLVAEPTEATRGLREAPMPMLAVSVAMAVLIIIFGVWPQATADFAKTAAEALVANIDAYIRVILG